MNLFYNGILKEDN